MDGQATVHIWMWLSPVLTSSLIPSLMLASLCAPPNAEVSGPLCQPHALPVSMTEANTCPKTPPIRTELNT
eukprot:6417914-Amphidinium_carterae.1